MSSYEDRRIGHFRIPHHIIAQEPEMARAAMKDMIVLRCELIAWSDDFDYIAISPYFEEINQYDLAPDYEAQFEMNGGKPAFKGWRRK